MAYKKEFIPTSKYLFEQVHLAGISTVDISRGFIDTNFVKQSFTYQLQKNEETSADGSTDIRHALKLCILISGQ